MNWRADLRLVGGADAPQIVRTAILCVLRRQPDAITIDLMPALVGKPRGTPKKLGLRIRQGALVSSGPQTPHAAFRRSIGQSTAQEPESGPGGRGR